MRLHILYSTILIFFCLIFPLFSERIYFKNGDVLTVRIIRLNRDYALVTSPLGDYRIPREHIKKIENTEKYTMQVKLKTGKTLVLQFLDADMSRIRFILREQIMSYSWEEIEDSVFLEL
ncbi:hypothetical protein [Leptospira sp. GIMC2001]|uniref:hypothetical protein n=1 Tax=Leptospira sp. GIMC2001 TaxID=1513297 RepID=UPI002349B4DD|nr:hypothetical protein [Leptospira sp. GIMC2001]WCL47747.1 hypothetical protein O4O04_00385 [Leptospira sp. GIMC2001]